MTRERDRPGSNGGGWGLGGWMGPIRGVWLWSAMRQSSYDSMAFILDLTDKNRY